MSLFPAYSKEPTDETQKIEEKDSWLNNSSFIPTKFPSKNEDSSDAGEGTSASPPPKKRHKKEKKKKHKRDTSSPDLSKLNYLNNPNVDYYEEKSGVKSFLSVTTLHRPACPKYHLSNLRFHGMRHAVQREKSKRYFLSVKKLVEKEKKNYVNSNEVEDIQKELRLNPKDVEKWLKYLEIKDIGPSNYQKEKARLEIAEKAVKLNPESEELLKEYLNILPKVHPTDEALEIIQGLLNKDANNYHLWNALIYNKQSAMAQCLIPDVLKLYEKCMTTLFSVIKNDEILVKIFKNCAIFMRQSGLWEQFFTLIHLALSLNVSSTAFSNSGKFYSEENQQILIEYEELILKSGLPMNEIWLRIEKLRSAYNFLPCRGVVESDPQRMVLNEDVCHYIFPLINQSYNFDLFILVLKMLKYPFGSSGLFQNSTFFAQEIHEYDCIEDVLPVFFTAKRDKNFDEILFLMIKEMNFPPSIINSNLAYENFFEVIVEILLPACTCFTTKQNLIIFRLYLQLERVLIILEKLKSPELPKEFKKKVKSRIKKAIKSLKYQENLLVYNDFAWIEYEMDGLDAAEGIFVTTMQQNFIDSIDFMTLMLSYVEILLANDKKEKAIEILTESALGKVDFKDSEIANTKKIVALQKQADLLALLLETEKKSGEIETEDYFTQSRFMLVLKSRLYLLYLIKSTDAALELLKVVISSFQEKNNQKNIFIREQCYELAAFLPHTNGVFDLIQRGLEEFPHNLQLLKTLATSLSVSWLKIRSSMSRNLTTNALVFLIAACKYRSYNIENSEEAYKKRVLNILKDATSDKSEIRQNALIWRFYLRALFDVDSSTTLVKCKHTLYEALDVCPWSKSLYLDGAFFAPQELSQLLDLIMEKQLRIHALPEELSILRAE